MGRLVEVLRWEPLDTLAGRVVVGGVLILVGLAAGIAAVRLPDTRRASAPVKRPWWRLIGRE